MVVAERVADALAPHLLNHLLVILGELLTQLVFRDSSLVGYVLQGVIGSGFLNRQVLDTVFVLFFHYHAGDVGFVGEYRLQFFSFLMQLEQLAKGTAETITLESLSHSVFLARDYLEPHLSEPPLYFRLINHCLLSRAGP